MEENPVAFNTFTYKHMNNAHINVNLTFVSLVEPLDKQNVFSY